MAMEVSAEHVWKLVYRDGKVWYNTIEDCIWRKRIFCLMGFEDSVDSGKDLILRLISSLISRGASIVRYPNPNLDTKLIQSIDFFLCNYSQGYEIKPSDVTDSKLVTPIWLYTCNRDDVIYSTEDLPIFKAVQNFRALKFINSNITLSVFGATDYGLPKGHQELRVPSIKYDLDTLARFIRHCGFTYADYDGVKNKYTGTNRSIYFLICRVLGNGIEESVTYFSKKYKIPCLSIEWLFDTYISGEIKDIKNYHVNLQFSEITNTKMKRRKMINQQISQSQKNLFHNKTVCFSYLSAVENELQLGYAKNMGASNVFVVNPLYVLAPWAMEKVPHNKDRQMYNSISLIEDTKVMLFLGRDEYQDNALGLFAHLSFILEENISKTKRELRARNIEIYKSFNTTPERIPQKHDLIEIPEELIQGRGLISCTPKNNELDKFNLYDLADSITFAETEDFSQYQEETLEQTNRQMRARLLRYIQICP